MKVCVWGDASIIGASRSEPLFSGVNGNFCAYVRTYVLQGLYTINPLPTLFLPLAHTANIIFASSGQPESVGVREGHQESERLRMRQLRAALTPARPHNVLVRRSPALQPRTGDWWHGVDIGYSQDREANE